MAGWSQLRGLVKGEVTQRREEGCNVEEIQAEIQASPKLTDSQLMEIYQRLMALKPSSEFPFQEPNGLEEIRGLRPEGPRKLTYSLTEEQWKDKFYGAWLGRCSGCALGLPFENPTYMSGDETYAGWQYVEKWYKGANAWPMNNYAPFHSEAEKTHNIRIFPFHKPATREHITFMPTDDDIRYTVLGLMALEQFGFDFDTWDIGKLWHRILPYQSVCTAETKAYLNFAQVTHHYYDEKPEDWREKLEWVRMHLNPFREWIGAQIRADGFAYGAAGNPELAAELAWRDASLSHVKNGIYGEMFVAAMISAAFVEDDIERVIQIGLSEIPSTSRLAKDIKIAIEIAKSTTDQLVLVERIWHAFNHYHPVHTNNNAALVVAALIHGGGDFTKAMTTAVLGGWDTDCNGATVGSIMGAMLGKEGIPAHWIEPLNDTLYSQIPGFHPISIQTCSERSFEVFKKLNR
ncbi:hypothetical protein ASG89_05155 [Paenibacillus sp. Soil766]|uniref:ADP-ribosylglycohydrolase family protein n=1 Tax=Paenibacillus sp. Soil766 TaxID=1736404 RepID=UPI00070EB3A9|nr:ADP-ribosylglycohydrolase family protein [Paenibacillus sp. Soil766]KRE98401.1 hypothetical protein ASG89_05155 [Paenibacillus sp. Soil766]